MLTIVFGDKEDIMYGPSWFRFNYKPEWFEDGLVQEMLKDIDRSVYMGGELIQSEVLGPIPPERLSGGLQTLISIYNRPDLIFNATSCGENCAKWLIRIGEKEDISINLRYFMPFDGCEPFIIRIQNEDKVVYDMHEYTHLAIKYV